MATLSDNLDNYCFLDFETRSKPGGGDVKTLGTWRYARASFPIILTWCIGDGPVMLTDTAHHSGLTFLPMSMPLELTDFYQRAVAGQAWFCAWNTSFDRCVWNQAFPEHPLTPEMTIDVAAQGMASNLPPDLQHASKAVGGEGKQGDGKKLIKLFSVADGATPKSHPDEWARFKTYAVQDTHELRLVFQATRPLPEAEWEEYWASERINDRGIALDVEFCRAAARVAEANKWWANARLLQLTGDPKIRVTTVQRIAEWVYARLDTAEAREILETGVADADENDEGDEPSDLSLARVRIARLLAYLRANDGDPSLIEVLELREYGGSSSPAKFAKMATQEDGGRLKNQYVFNGAQQTGRFSSRGVQVHNLPRASIGGIEAEENAILDIIEAVQAMGSK